jgi:Cd2+/Zn2+-exporting ATPase
MAQTKSQLINDDIYKKYKEAIASALFLAAALIVEHGVSFAGQPYVYLPLYGLSYIVVGGPVWMKAFRSIKNGTILVSSF